MIPPDYQLDLFDTTYIGWEAAFIVWAFLAIFIACGFAAGYSFGSKKAR